MRAAVNTTLDKDLYKTIQIMALQLSDSKKKDNERVEGIE